MGRYLLSLMILISLLSCKNKIEQEMNEHEHTNHLINETSPYLLQHAHNPVDWHPWNEETLALAKKENRLMLISIGYAACHWCHVMEHESFEDTAVAEVMNKYFINIKVDREERPDVDQIYMNAVQLLTGRGGWPLNAIALPDGRPVWGGTYFPKDNWIKTIEQVAQLYEDDPEKLKEYAANLTEGIKQSSLVTLNESPADYTLTEINKGLDKWYPYLDIRKGGSKGAPKFPMPVNLEFLLRFGFQTKNDSILDYVNTSLTQMANGGIYDQVGGGFARYSVDNRWHIPHFEKMLYDNAQLVSLYANAYRINPNEQYKNVVFETLQFVERELSHESGAFYSSLDADSLNEQGELEEGAFYVWKKEELQAVLGDDFDLFADFFNVNLNGKWENDTYHLIKTKSVEEFAQTNGLDKEVLIQKINIWRDILYQTREDKPRPRLDDKTLTSWNALMLKGYVDAYTAFNEKHFLEMALKNAHFLVTNQLKEDGSLYRNYKNGQSSIEAYLEDYATLSEAFISLYQATLDENWLRTAKQLTDYCFDQFFDENSKMFYFTSQKSKDLITRKIEIEDNVIPSSNSITANNLFLLGHYFYNKNYLETASAMLNNVKEQGLGYMGASANWFLLYTNYLEEFYEIAVVGKDALTKIKEINQTYIPNKLLVGSIKNSDLPLLEAKYNPNNTTIFVCIDGACQLPEQDTEKALKQINTIIGKQK